ncbi:unnamed protein product [Rotaria magnacalcarata]|uniref:Uncharacterized protein n=1 Tax=Rotaria magnacalcarata TaxID=392030 RepID=A0A819M2M5_9BILA|nr:unnamed protein product [Rotaria magnacalcarata]CAF1585196.1 unnamed protein product [Rotaria magnacalcarata]CAF1920726.1 unnamed protein product [Rotaria magnacalcarata]CAF2045165.1 unnamed protein product [Rotaria magnacalcarata]CAF2188057.1 unnamed protein product [Rotaria magnacalcarata]
MLTAYLTHSIGLLHIIRFICIIILLTLSEIKISSCQTYLNEFLGFDHSSILFYYILIWISFSFEIYILLNRLLGTISIKAQYSIKILYSLLSLFYLLASCFTLYAIIHSSNGHVITQSDFSETPQTIIQLLPNCNLYRLIGILFGILISFLYFIAIIIIHRLKD